MTEAEKRVLYLSCKKFLNGHYPQNLKDQLSRLADHTAPEELTDFYGSGLLIEEFEAEIADLLGQPSAIFMPSGTMAQLIALRIWCDHKNNQHIGMHPTSHLALHEQDAYKHLHNLSATFLGDKDRCLTINDFEQSKADYAAAIIELPQRELGGILPSWGELQAMSNFCRERKIFTHLDGARLWECAPFYQKSYADICAVFDSIYVSFYKGIGGISGAALAGPSDFIAEARVWQRRYGGNLIRLFPYVLSARKSMRQRLPRMAAYHEKAIAIAEALGRIPGVSIEPKIPSANMMHIFFDRDSLAVESSFIKLAKEQKIAGFFKVQSCEENLCKAELSVGDATLDLSIQEIVKIFEDVNKEL